MTGTWREREVLENDLVISSFRNVDVNAINQG